MIKIIVATALMSGGLTKTCSEQKTKLFADATAVWQFGRKDEPGVSANGNVRLGVALSGAERQASLLRGGDGLIASLTGGHLRVGGDRNINLTGKYMTLYARMRASGGKESISIFARDDAKDPQGVFLSMDKDGFRYVWRTLPAEKMVLPGMDLAKWPKPVLEGAIPLDARLPEADRTVWHDVILRFNNAKLELFIDGVPMAEDWPYGEILNFTEPFLIGSGYRDQKIESGFTGQIDIVALWNSALRDDEVVRLSGGKTAVAERRRVLGPRYTWPLQYWSLPSASVGDPMALFSDNTFHVFLGVKENKPTRMDDAHGKRFSWHMSSPDLIHWTMHPKAAEPKGDEGQFLSYVCTGDYIKKGDRYY